MSDFARYFGTASPGSMGDYPDCDCGHASPRHHGDDRSGSPIIRDTACKDCSWCDYYKPRFARISVDVGTPALDGVGTPE